jgi:hypothetical protein
LASKTNGSTRVVITRIGNYERRCSRRRDEKNGRATTGTSDSSASWAAYGSIITNIAQARARKRESTDGSRK